MTAGSRADAALVTRTRAVWEAALGVPVDDDTDFFWVGGHSFMALQIVQDVAAAVSSEIPLRMLFDHPRFQDFVEALAAHTDPPAIR